jgi:hypothetical protein
MTTSGARGSKKSSKKYYNEVYYEQKLPQARKEITSQKQSPEAKNTTSKIIIVLGR